ncbi:MAG: hypothetical protein M1822_009979 [Bathelium mastoideum]|nr:MAG: hypothetical protein M1822_009979 [Bathelium mastoideum]
MSSQSRSHGFRGFFKHIAAVWGPLLYAKEGLDDTYNFPRARMAGQGRLNA